MTAPAVPKPENKESLDARLSRPLPAAIIAGSLLLVMVILEVIDSATSGDLDLYGIKAQEVDGLPGIFSAPFLHAGFSHLWSNAVPFFVLGFLTIIGGLKRFVLASIGIIIISGLFAWGLTFGSGTQIIVGASGWVFGLITYLLARGIFTRNVAQIVISVIVLVLYGSVLFGVLPGRDGISWQGHLGGAIAGVLMAWVLSRGDRPRKQPETAH